MGNFPDVTMFAELDATGESAYNDPNINIFKRIFEEECGLAKKPTKYPKKNPVSFVRDLRTMIQI